MDLSGKPVDFSNNRIVLKSDKEDGTQDESAELCKVCSDEATGMNFGVLTCESCKAFYRRSFQSVKQIKCPFMGLCEINKHSRKFCQACRLQKCIGVGMRREKLFKRVRHKSSTPKSEVIAPEITGTSTPKSEVIGPEIPLKSLILPMVPENTEPGNYGESSNSNLQQSKSECACAACGNSSQDFGSGQSNMSNGHSVMSSAEHFPALSEQQLIDELIRANSVLDEPLVIPSERISAHNQPLDPANLSLLDVIRISDLAMRRIISMAKQISLFMGLGQEDQLALLKGGLTELLILRGAMVFDPKKDAWRHQIYCLPKTNELNILGATGSQSAASAINGQPNDMNLVHLTVDILKQAQEQQHYVEHKKYKNNSADVWRQDFVMLLLSALCLFCPQRNHIEDIAKVENIRNTYSGVLKRYLASRPELFGPDTYNKLLHKLRDLQRLNQSLQRIYRRFDPSELDPLLLELLQTVPQADYC